MDGAWLALTTVGLVAMDALACRRRGSPAKRFPFLVGGDPSTFGSMILPPGLLTATSFRWPVRNAGKGDRVLVVAPTTGNAQYRALGLATIEGFYDPDELDEGERPPAYAQLFEGHAFPSEPGRPSRETVEGYVRRRQATDGTREAQVLVLELLAEPKLGVRRISDRFPTLPRGSTATKKRFPFLVHRSATSGHGALLVPLSVLRAAGFRGDVTSARARGETALVLARTSGDAAYRALGLARVEGFFEDLPEGADAQAWQPDDLGWAHLSGGERIEGTVRATYATTGTSHGRILVMDVSEREPRLGIRRITDRAPALPRGSSTRRRPKPRVPTLEEEGSAARTDQYGIVDPNGSGQGYHPAHANHPYHAILTGLGWDYSHTTPVHVGESVRLHHTWVRENHRVGVENGSWQAGILGSSRRTHGRTAEGLAKYLKGVKIPKVAHAWLVVAVRDGRIRQVAGMFWALADADAARDRLAKTHGHAWVVGQSIGGDRPRYAVVVALPAHAPGVPFTVLGVYETVQAARAEARRAAFFDQVHSAGAAGWGPSRDLAVYELTGGLRNRRIADKKTTFLPRITDVKGSRTTKPLTDEDRLDVLGLAALRDLGCGSGACGGIAVAMRRVLFGEDAEVVAVANKYLWEKRGHFVGHVGVRAGDIIWDGEGTYEGEEGLEEFLAWGMLDPEDPDYRFPRRGRDAFAYETVLLEGDDALRAVKKMGLRGVEQERILREALAAWRQGERP